MVEIIGELLDLVISFAALCVFSFGAVRQIALRDVVDVGPFEREFMALGALVCALAVLDNVADVVRLAT